jgi:hypothetical protein
MRLFILVIIIAVITALFQIWNIYSLSHISLSSHVESFEDTFDLDYQFMEGKSGYFKLGTFLLQWGIQYFENADIMFTIPFTQFFGIQCYRVDGKTNNTKFNIQPQLYDEKSVTMRANASVIPYCWIAYGLKT